MANLEDIIPDEDHGTDTAFRYGFQDLLVVPLCAELAQRRTDLVGIYPEFVEDIAVEHESFWRFIQVKSHNETKPPWTLTELIESGALSSLWRARQTVHETAAQRGIPYQLGVWLSGPLTGTRSKGRRDLVHVLAAHGEGGRLVDRARWLERIQDRFDDCSEDEAAKRIEELVGTLAQRIKVKGAGSSRALTKDEARILVDLCWVEDMPPLDGMESAARLGLHEQLPDLNVEEFNHVFERLLARIKRAASAAGERSQHARLFATVVHGPEIGEARRLQAEAKRLSYAVVAPLLEPLTRAPTAEGRVADAMLQQVTTYRGPAALRLNYLAETSGTLDYFTDAFVGREAEQQRVHDFVAAAEPASSYLLIEASGGLGKSALMARLIRMGRTGRWPGAPPDIVYFFISRRGARNTATAFLQAVNSQLLDFLGLALGLPATLDELRTQFSELWPAAQQASDPAAPLVMFVDGLDEMEPASAAYPVTIADVLPVPSSPSVRVVVSSRPRPDARERVAPSHPLACPEQIQLRTFEDAEARAMVAFAFAESAHLHTDLVDLDDAALDGLVRRVMGVTRGEPLFLRLVSDELPQGGWGALEELEERPPKDAEGYFRQQFAALDEVTEGDVTWRILGVLAVTRAGVTLRDVADILGEPPRTVRRASRPIDRFLIGKDRVELMHDRLHCLVRDEFSRAELAELGGLLLAWCARYGDRGWPEDTPTYVLDQYSAHLEDLDDLSGLLGLVSREWMARHLESYHTYGGYVRDVERAWAVLQRSDTLDWVELARCSLVLATLRSVAEAAPPPAIEALAQLGRTAEAEGLAELVPNPVQRGEAHARLGRAALQRGSRDAASDHATIALEALATAELGGLTAAYEPLCDLLTALGDVDRLTRAVDIAVGFDGPDDWAQPAMALAIDSLAALGVEVELDPESADKLLYLDELARLAILRDDANVLARIAQILATADSDPHATALLAGCRASLGHEASAEASRALELARGSFALAQVGRILARHGFEDDAASAFDRAISALEGDTGDLINPKSGAPELVRALGRQGDLPRLKRVQAYAAGLEGPTASTVHEALALGFADAGDLEEARRCIAAANSGGIETTAWLGVIRTMIAAKHLDTADELALSNPEKSRTKGLAHVALAWATTPGANNEAVARALDRAYRACAAANALGDEDYRAAAELALARALAADWPADAKRLMESVTKESEDTTSRTQAPVSSLVAGWAAVGEVDRAQNVAERAGWSWAHETLGSIVRAAVELRDRDRAVWLLNKMEESLHEELYDLIGGQVHVAEARLMLGLPINVDELVAAACDPSRDTNSGIKALSRVIEMLVEHDKLKEAQALRPQIDALPEVRALMPLLRGDLAESEAIGPGAHVGRSASTAELCQLCRVYDLLGDTDTARVMARTALKRTAEEDPLLSWMSFIEPSAIRILLSAGEESTVDALVEVHLHNLDGWWRARQLGSLATAADAVGDHLRIKRWLHAAFSGSRSERRIVWFNVLNTGAPALLTLVGRDGVMRLFDAIEAVDSWMAHPANGP